ncbi:MAG TPA: inner membrane CreD family protein [Terriglobales bacterium]|nr:inner membrane CreD family protein [Terriglobales bacterium]
MTKRIAALIFIFGCTTLAWIILASTIFARTYTFSDRLGPKVGSTWGTRQEQEPPTATYTVKSKENYEVEEKGRTVVKTREVSQDYEIPVASSDIDVALDLDHRPKGLLWYSTYKVAFNGTYTFTNPTDKDQVVTLSLKFPAEKAMYDELFIRAEDQDLPITNVNGAALAKISLAAGKTVTVKTGYRSQGMESWGYKLGAEVAQARNFTLTMHTNFKDIDFAENTLSPTHKRRTDKGWDLIWKYQNLVSGFEIGVTMPEKLQPGPLAGQISYFAPVSLLFFFFLMFIITTMKGIDLHPMNYFFLATSFFAFHLLLAYLVDHMSIHLAFVICSLVSIFLVVSYLRIVVGPKFAFIEAGITQFVYLVLFSYAFFFKGFTGLAITIGAIVTLFVVMQVTAKINWSEKFAGLKPPAAPRQNPLNGESWVRG